MRRADSCVSLLQTISLGMGPANLYLVCTPGGLSVHSNLEKHWFRVSVLEDEKPSGAYQVIVPIWFSSAVTREL